MENIILMSAMLSQNNKPSYVYIHDIIIRLINKNGWIDKYKW